MELGVKVAIGGVALFVMGGLSVYLLTSQSSNTVPPTPTAPAVSAVPASTSSATGSDSSATSAESFYAAAEARREQQLIDKSEADRLAKLKKIKENSTECKFWKQQNKTSSAAAKIEEKITQHCTLPTSSSESSSSLQSEDNPSGE